MTVPAIVEFKRELEIIAPELPTSNAIPIEKMKSAIMVAVQKTPKLLDADRSSLWQSARMCAADGLVPDGREAAFVLFKTKKKDERGNEVWVDAVQYIPMVFGLRKRAMMSGEVKDIRAYLVYEGEWSNGRFEMIAGDEERIEHRPIVEGAPGEPERGKVIGGYAVAVLSDGRKIREWLPLSAIEKRRRAAPSQRVYEKGQTPRVSDVPLGVWADWWEEQALKTLVRAVSKKLPLSSDDMRAIMESDHDADFEHRITREQEPRPTLADRLKAAQQDPAHPAPLSGEQEGAGRDEPDQPGPAPDDIEDGEIVPPEFDVADAFPGSVAWTKGELAAVEGLDEGENPYTENPDFSSWLGGFRQKRALADG